MTVAGPQEPEPEPEPEPAPAMLAAEVDAAADASDELEDCAIEVV